MVYIVRVWDMGHFHVWFLTSLQKQQHSWVPRPHSGAELLAFGDKISVETLTPQGKRIRNILTKASRAQPLWPENLSVMVDPGGSVTVGL